MQLPEQLPEHYKNLAADGSEIRPLFSIEKAASVVHCTLPPKATSNAIYNVGIDEIWYFITGQGEVWRREKGINKQDDVKEGEEVRVVGPGTCLTMPANVAFQFRSTSKEPLTFICVTTPPFPGKQVNVVIPEGHWQPAGLTQQQDDGTPV